MINLKNGAIIIADVHYDKYRKNFEYFLDYIEKNQPPQLILLGDIFNLLIGGIKNSVKENENIIKRLDELALKIEIIYFEGNHDFNLNKIFKNIKIIKNQPILINFNGKNIAISHGDIFLPPITQIALRFLRLKSIIFILNLLNTIFLNKIYIKICDKQKTKQIYKKLKNFKTIVNLRTDKYIQFFKKQSNTIDYIIEGHFHQGNSYEINNLYYKNLDAFASDNSFFILEYDKNIYIRKVTLSIKE